MIIECIAQKHIFSFEKKFKYKLKIMLYLSLIINRKSFILTKKNLFQLNGYYCSLVVILLL